MNKSIAFVLSLLASTAAFSGPPYYYCTSMAGTWAEYATPSSVWSLKQNGSSINGTLTTSCGASCTCTYTVTGTISPFSSTSANTFPLHGTLSSGPPGSCFGVQNLTAYIPLGTSGCATAYPEKNPGPGAYPLLVEQSCTIPGGGSGVGEGPSHFLSWKTSPGVALALFKAGPLVTPLNGSTFDWSGRAATENNNVSGQTCSSGGYEIPTPTTWYLDGNYLGDGANGNPPDGIGPTSPDENVIPNRRSAASGSETLPCSYTIDQYMYIDCPASLGGNQQFEHHQVIYTIGPDYISVKRGSEPSSNQPYGPIENTFKLISTFLRPRHH